MKTRLLAVLLAAAVRLAGAETIVVDAAAPRTPFPHFWERMFGSGRAILSLRESYRQDLRAVKAATDFQYVRFHDILDDDVGLYTTNRRGVTGYNFSTVDEIYDGLLDLGVRPMVELSFMPSVLAASSKPHNFWYKPLPAPPKDYGRWGELVRTLVQHLSDRYGADEVAQWYFEVWNEPNIDFWTGDPKQATYFQLYDAAARAVKGVSPRFRVGGPATARAAWVPDFLAHCAEAKVPVDFVSTHIYGSDKPLLVLGSADPVPRRDMVARAVKMVWSQVQHSAFPGLPVIWSEYNATARNDVHVTDSAFMGPWLANTIRQCDGLTTMMSYWDFSDVFDEQGNVLRPFYGGYGLIAAGHIPKAAFNDFILLHELGAERLANASESALVTRLPNGSLAIALWNYADPGEQGYPEDFALVLKRWTGSHSARVRIVDPARGSALGAWEKMGAPLSPTRAEQKTLRTASLLPAAVTVALERDQLVLHLPPHALALVEIPFAPKP